MDLIETYFTKIEDSIKQYKATSVWKHKICLLDNQPGADSKHSITLINANNIHHNHVRQFNAMSQHYTITSPIIMDEHKITDFPRK